MGLPAHHEALLNIRAVSVGTALSGSSPRGSIAPPRLGESGLAERRTAIAVGLLCGLGAALRFYRLGHQGFWFDEANTVLLVHFSLGKMIGLIPHTESTPPLYYCVAWVWARVFGFGEAGLRSLSAVAGVVTIPVAYGAGAKLVSRRTGLAVAALCACNPFLLWYSQEARSYSLLVLFSALALLAFAYLLEEPTRRRAGIWVVCCALALATHYYAAVVVVPQAGWLLFQYRRDGLVQAAVGLAIACGLALVPLALSQHSTGHDSWIGHSPIGIRLAQIVPQFLIGTDAPIRTVLKFTAMALALGALGLLLTVPSRLLRQRAWLAGGLALAGFLLSLAFAGAGSDALITRNIIGVWLPAAIAVGGGLALGRPRLLGAALATGLCAIGLTAAIAVETKYDFGRPDWRLVAQALGRDAPARRPRVILIQHYKTLLPLSLYMPGLRFLGHHGARGVRELDVIAISSPQQPLCWWGAACNLIPSQMQTSYAVPGFHEVWLRRVRRFTIMHMVAFQAGAELTPGEVARALYTTTLPRDDLLIQR